MASVEDTEIKMTIFRNQPLRSRKLDLTPALWIRNKENVKMAAIAIIEMDPRIGVKLPVNKTDHAKNWEGAKSKNWEQNFCTSVNLFVLPS